MMMMMMGSSSHRISLRSEFYILFWAATIVVAEKITETLNVVPPSESD